MEFKVVLAIICIYIYMSYVDGMFTALAELFAYKITEIATNISLRTQEKVKLFNLKYPDIPEQETHAIGFHMPEPTNEEDVDDVDISENKNPIGFRM